MAILLTLTFIKNNKPDKNKINIFTDCQLVLSYLKFIAFPKYNNIRLIMQAIFKTLLLIQNLNTNLQIIFKKVKSHSNIIGNNIIDNLVRKTAKQISYNPCHFQHIPYSVTLTQIHKYSSKSWKTKWKLKSNPLKWITKSHHNFNLKIHNLINKAKLNYHQCGIIIRLIAEH